MFENKFLSPWKQCYILWFRFSSIFDFHIPIIQSISIYTMSNKLKFSQASPTYVIDKVVGNSHIIFDFLQSLIAFESELATHTFRRGIIKDKKKVLQK